MNGMTPNYSDKDRLQDALSSQKFITEGYNTYTYECATPNVRSMLKQFLNEEHEIQHEIFTEMQSRGWYKVAPAEQQKINEARTKFQGSM